MCVYGCVHTCSKHGVILLFRYQSVFAGVFVWGQYSLFNYPLLIIIANTHAGSSLCLWVCLCLWVVADIKAAANMDEHVAD